MDSFPYTGAESTCVGNEFKKSVMTDEWEEWLQYHSGITGVKPKWVNEEMKEITAKGNCISEMTPKWPEWGWNERNERDFRTSLKFEGAEIEASYWSRAQNRGLWLVESGRFQKFKSSAFRPGIPVIPLISASFRPFWSHSWNKISFCNHQIHYGMTAVWLIPLHSKLIQTQPISFYIHSISWTPSPIRAQSLPVLGMSLKSQ